MTEGIALDSVSGPNGKLHLANGTERPLQTRCGLRGISPTRRWRWTTGITRFLSAPSLRCTRCEAFYERLKAGP